MRKITVRKFVHDMLCTFERALCVNLCVCVYVRFRMRVCVCVRGGWV